MPVRSAERWMWLQACEILERAERLHRQFFDLERTLEGESVWTPPIDVFETEREFVIIAALPGVESEHLEVRLERNTLIVAGRRRLPAAARTAVFHRLEIPLGRFERRVDLPAVPLAIDRHTFANGCLTLSLRKTP